MDRSRHRRRRVAVAGCLAVAALVVLGLGCFLRLDKTAVFYEVRGEYATARLLDEWTLGESRCRWVQLRNHRGEAVTTAYVRTPATTPARPRILLTYAGEKTGKAMLTLIPQRPDLVLVAVQYPYHRPRGVIAHLRWPYDVRRAVFRAVAGGMLAVSFLAEEEGMPVDRLTVLGASLGTSFAVIHAALDPRVSSVMVVHGGGDLPAVLWDIERRAGRRWRAPLAAGLAAVMVDSFDPVHYVDRIAPRPLFILASRHDRYFPVHSAQALYDRAREPKTLRWTDSEHVGAKKKALVTEIVEQLESHLDALPAGAPPPLDGR